MPLDASSTIASPGASASPTDSRDFGLISPVQEAARSMRPASTMPASAGVSPPPQATPQVSQACFQPATSACARCASPNHSLPPAAQ
ncbi:hypothetical protein Mpe_A2535 [Methylibium petroleiphilum PM1]|uniref:Uncharacterized protein n=1 Tax=Methylibium petroleiphilum (strain ATCC BAA-1232 / LMG 22953 / PM1) TaxID=420662 RepID=A2SIV1_METPP|nr:hypothetical protein Mpe_A2535 [Methylibium petroleiphilum PM1]